MSDVKKDEPIKKDEGKNDFFPIKDVEKKSDDKKDVAGKDADSKSDKGDKKSDDKKSDEKKTVDVDKDPDPLKAIAKEPPKKVEGKITGGEMKDHDRNIDARQSAKPVPTEFVPFSIDSLK